MGTVRFSHHGQKGTTIHFPYTAEGSKAITQAERMVKRLAARSRKRGSKRDGKRSPKRSSMRY